MLKININKFLKAYLNNLKKELDATIEENFREDVKKYVSDSSVPTSIREGIEVGYESKLKNNAKRLIVYLKANSNALASSYGVGSLMNTTKNPLFQEYWNSRGNEKGQVNPARTGKEIQGRPVGNYTDLFGGEHEVKTGDYTGENLEERFNYHSFGPTYAIPDAEKNFFEQYVPNAIKRAIAATNLSSFIEEIPDKSK